MFLLKFTFLFNQFNIEIHVIRRRRFLNENFSREKIRLTDAGFGIDGGQNNAVNYWKSAP